MKTQSSEEATNEAAKTTLPTKDSGSGHHLKSSNEDEKSYGNKLPRKILKSGSQDMILTKTSRSKDKETITKRVIDNITRILEGINKFVSKS